MIGRWNCQNGMYDEYEVGNGRDYSHGGNGRDYGYDGYGTDGFGKGYGDALDGEKDYDGFLGGNGSEKNDEYDRCVHFERDGEYGSVSLWQFGAGVMCGADVNCPRAH